jgi:hypothetical protein|nr:hypothetical protein [Phenylobacterium sp.]
MPFLFIASAFCVVAAALAPAVLKLLAARRS